MPFQASASADVIDRLLALTIASKGQPGGLVNSVTVTDGPGVTGNPGSRLIIGADSPDEAIVQAVTGQQEWAHANGTSRNEEFDVFCTAVAWNGNPGDRGQKKARDEAIAMGAAVATICVTNPTLDVATLWWARFGGQVALTYRQDDQGVTAVFVFQIHCKARI